ncbi:MAG: hypothetical protein FWF49_06585, partial [Oscillospiraceae bacterium]|nr:hypothetical protein [Oscillospiraceae bacterium]
MNIVRRIAAICFCLAVAAALPVGLAGCGPKSAAPSSGATDTTQPDTTQTETSTLLSTQALADIFPDLSRAQYSVYSLHGDLVYIASQSGTVSVVARGDSGGQIEETYANGEPDAGTAYVYGHVFSIVLSGKADGVPNRLVTIDDSLTLNER